jgi:tetraprenyl-beta-curcumene synthase
VARELAWVLPTVSREVKTWRALATSIPTAAIRQDALSALEHKRGHTDGAALFCILPRVRDPDLLRLLVAYEIIWDFLDCVNERGADRGQANGRQLHLALVDALNPDAEPSDYYRYHPWSDDGGYLEALVRCCQEACRNLPSYPRVRQLLNQEAWHAQVSALNHELDPERRDHALRKWALLKFPGKQEVSWYELTGAASASLTIHALLALAAKPSLSETEIAATHNAYFPWISAATTMLDSFVDQAEDQANGDHSYVAHYPSAPVAVLGIEALVQRSIAEASTLPDGERHTLIVACMIAMYLSKDSAQTSAARRDIKTLVSAGGPLPCLLLPILHMWRIAYAQRGA